MLLTCALERFLEQLHADGRSPHTVGQYRRHVALFTRWLAQDAKEEPSLAHVTHERLARFLGAPVARQRSDGEAKRATAVNALRTSMRVFSSYLHRAGYLSQDPGRLIRRAACSPPPPRGLSADEEARLLASIAQDQSPRGRRDHALLRFLLRSGVRLSAALGLHVEDLDLALGTAEILTKGARRDRVLLSGELVEHLRAYLGDRVSGVVFPGPKGESLSRRHVLRMLKQRLKAAGVERSVCVHGLRHTFALSLYQRTGDVLLVKEALGHRSISSTMVYAQAGEDRLRRALG